MRKPELGHFLDSFGLPCGPEDLPEDALNPKPPILGGVKLLIIDDDSDLRRLFCRFLTRAGASVFAADSAQQARCYLSLIAFDAILSDIAMPGEDGITLLKNIRGDKSILNQKTPAIAITGFKEKLAEIQEAGYEACLTKPISPLTLIAKVENVVTASPRLGNH